MKHSAQHRPCIEGPVNGTVIIIITSIVVVINYNLSFMVLGKTLKVTMTSLLNS